MVKSREVLGSRLYKLALALINNNISLLVMVVGAGAQLLSSVLLYKVLSPQDYGLYGVFITFLSVSTSFGLLGAEQSFLRLSSVSESKVLNISRLTCFCLAIGVVLGPVLIVFLLNEKMVLEVPIVMQYIFALTAALLMFLANIERLLENFVSSQIISNYWRVVLLISLVSYFFIGVSFSYILNILFGTFCLGVLITLFLVFKTNKFEVSDDENSAKYVGKLFLSFLFSMGVLTVLNFFDRYLIQTMFDLEVFGRYFFLLSIFAYPMVLIANYVGFKGLVRYKKEFIFLNFKKELIKVMLISILMSSALALTAVIVDSYFNMSFDFLQSLNLIIPIAVLGCIKICYASLSAAMGARGQAGYIFYSNLGSLFVALATIIAFFYIDLPIVVVAWACAGVWIFRCALYYCATYYSNKHQAID